MSMRPGRLGRDARMLAPRRSDIIVRAHAEIS